MVDRRLMDVQLQIPDDVARIIQSEQPDLSRAALEALAIEGYRAGRLSEAIGTLGVPAEAARRNLLDLAPRLHL